jgi:hypothetical protein
MSKTKLTEQDLQDVIMERLAKERECNAITQVYVSLTGHPPPEEAWVHFHGLSAR